MIPQRGCAVAMIPHQDINVQQWCLTFKNFLNGNSALKSTQARLDLNHRSISSLVEYCENEYRLE